MRKRRVVLTPDANADLDQIGEFVSGIYREEVGIRFVKRMFLEIIPLGISADAFPLSRLRTAREIHPEAKTIPIIYKFLTFFSAIFVDVLKKETNKAFLSYYILNFVTNRIYQL